MKLDKNLWCICLMMTSPLVGEQFSFHRLIPATWYEKGLGATIVVWNKLCMVLDDGNRNPSLEEFDIVLGRFAFAHFCLEKMYQQKQRLLDDDVAYFARLLYQLEDKLITMSCDSVHQDRLECLVRMVKVMKRSLHVPADF